MGSEVTNIQAHFAILRQLLRDGNGVIWIEHDEAAAAKPEPHWKFVQANTFRHGDHIEVKVYDQSNAGIIRSWAERDV